MTIFLNWQDGNGLLLYIIFLTTVNYKKDIRKYIFIKYFSKTGKKATKYGNVLM